MPTTLPAPTLEHFCDLHVELGPIRELGPLSAGAGRIVPIIGGTVSGPHVTGRILNVGADWQTIFGDGLAQLDTRYAFETDDGAVFEVTNFGHRHGPAEVLARVAAGENVDPASYYMRTHAQLKTGDPRYAWVNKMLFVGTGARDKSAVRISLFTVT